MCELAVNTRPPRTGHTREPDPTHNELKHTTTRKTATHERTPDKPHVHTHTHTSRNGERCQSTDATAPYHSHTHSATPTRERARQWNHRLREEYMVGHAGLGVYLEEGRAGRGGVGLQGDMFGVR